jgi:cell division protein FtsQ
MSVQAHPRFVRRRSRVREHGARRHVRRALWALLAITALWSVAWVAQSPLFSVTAIEIDGAINARAVEVLAEHDVYPGRPLVLIRTGTVEAALEADPWVKEASVRRRFPDRIEVRLTERREVAAVVVAEGWQTVSDDGRIMDLVTAAPTRLAQVGPRVAFTPGGETLSETMMGVVEFVAALPDDVIGRTSVTADGNQLVAQVDAHRIRLGAPTHMAAKAVALAAVLADDRLAPGATIDLIAPSRPAVSVPPSAAADDA